MNIEKQTAKRLYDESPEWFQEQLEEEFGKEFFQKKSFKDIKTFEDACSELEIDPKGVFHESDSPDEVAFKKLKVIIRAINQGWKPNWNDSNERKWWPWFTLSSGFGFSVSGYDNANARTTVGSRLCFQDKERSDYVATQFIDIYKAFLT